MRAYPQNFFSTKLKMAKYIATDSAAGADFTLAKGGEYEAGQFDKGILDSLLKDGLLVELNPKETKTSKPAAQRETRGGTND